MICEKHFDPISIKPQGTYKRLINGSVPTWFPEHTHKTSEQSHHVQNDIQIETEYEWTHTTDPFEKKCKNQEW